MGGGGLDLPDMTATEKNDSNTNCTAQRYQVAECMWCECCAYALLHYLESQGAST